MKIFFGRYKINPLVFIGIYIAYYVALYWIIFAANTVLGLAISTAAFSISKLVTDFVTVIPLGILLYDLDKPNYFKPGKTNWVGIALVFFHPFITRHINTMVITQV